MLHNLLKTMDLEVLACDFHRLDSWWNFKRVNSPFSRLYLITEGEASVTHHNTTFTLSPGTIHLIPCFTFCDMYCSESFAHYHVSFTSRIPGGADILSLIQCNYNYKASSEENNLFKRLFELNPECRLKELDPYSQLKREVQRSISGEFLLEREASKILETDGIMRLLLAPFLRNSQALTGKKSLHSLWLRKILTYIEDNINREITLKMLADQVSLHPTYFSDLFSELTGIRPIAYISGKRIAKSQMLLMSTSKSIKEIAFECGFASVSYFNRSFKKTFHISPGKYRGLET